MTGLLMFHVRLHGGSAHKKEGTLPFGSHVCAAVFRTSHDCNPKLESSSSKPAFLTCQASSRLTAAHKFPVGEHADTAEAPLLTVVQLFIDSRFQSTKHVLFI